MEQETKREREKYKREREREREKYKKRKRRWKQKFKNQGTRWRACLILKRFEQQFLVYVGWAQWAVYVTSLSNISYCSNSKY